MALRSHLKSRRLAAGLSQQALADRIGLTRQALLQIEADRQTPSTSVALRLAATLGCRVEDLFELASPDALDVTFASEADRVVVGRVRGRWVAHAAAATNVGADAVRASASSVTPVVESHRLESHVLVAGCAPLLGVLGDHLGRRANARLRWIDATSTRALELLGDDLVHISGSHLVDERTKEDNVPFVRRRFAERMLVVNLVRWRQGLVVAAGNPLGIRSVDDLVGRDLRVAWRERGAGAHKLLTRLLSRAGAPTPTGPTVRGHLEVARAIEYGAADVGVAIEGAALAHGLSFVPLAEERFDLVVRAELASTDAVVQLLDALDRPTFRREVAAIAGYDTALTGHAVTVEGTR